MPHLAIVAPEEISAFTDLTFDYKPAHQKGWDLKKYRIEEKEGKKSNTLPVRCEQVPRMALCNSIEPHSLLTGI